MNCTGIVNEGSPISFVASPSNDPCDEIDIEIKGGKAPYTVSVLAGQSGLYGNLTGVTKKSFKMRNSVAARQTFNRQSPACFCCTRPCISPDALTRRRSARDGF